MAAPLVAAALVSCGGGQGSGRVSASASVHDQCGRDEGASRLRIVAADGADLGAASLGPSSAPTTVLVSYGQSQTLCDWLPIAARVAKDTGARVVVVDRRGVGSSGGDDDARHWTSDLAAAARAVRGQSRLVAVGASLGSIVTFIAASASGPAGAVTPAASDTARISPGACAAVLVSPLADLEVGGATISSLAVTSFTRPLWLVYEAANPTISGDAAAIARRVRGEGRARVHTRAVATADHGLDLLEHHPDALALVEGAVRSCS